jgi:hypothetical protein
LSYGDSLRRRAEWPADLPEGNILKTKLAAGPAGNIGPFLFRPINRMRDARVRRVRAHAVRHRLSKSTVAVD